MEYIKPDLKKARKRTGSNTEEIDFVLEDQYKNIGFRGQFKKSTLVGL